jgi:multiple inositol-polyphosphate phosphatase/2,3-bisphosphoglycerate 3-phosphatase
MLELSDDIDIFFEKGPGREISYRIASPLLADMLTSMLAIVHNTSNTVINARFAHAETLLPLVALLELFPDELSLDADPQTLLNRTWASNIISPCKLLINAPSRQLDFR